jgi:hypothetical protein
VTAAAPTGPVSKRIANTVSRASGSARLHDFGRISVRAGGKCAETFPGIDDESAPDVKRSAGDAGVDGGAGGSAADAAAAPAASMTVSGDSYNDTASESHKNIKFSVSVPTGHDVKHYGLVNWLKGSMKTGSGSYFKIKLYGSEVEANFSDYQVDSVDADPLYWSDASARWNYTAASGGFSATDDPGPALTSEKGAVYALKFRMGLYKLADVPTTTSGTIAATAIQSVDWQYSVKVGSDGKFSHPAL